MRDLGGPHVLAADLNDFSFNALLCIARRELNGVVAGRNVACGLSGAGRTRRLSIDVGEGPVPVISVTPTGDGGTESDVMVKGLSKGDADAAWRAFASWGWWLNGYRNGVGDAKKAVPGYPMFSDRSPVLPGDSLRRGCQPLTVESVSVTGDGAFVDCGGTSIPYRDGDSPFTRGKKGGCAAAMLRDFSTRMKEEVDNDV